MPEHIFEQVAADMRRLTHPHLFRHGAPQPAALAPSTAVPHNGTQEDHMSLLAEIEDGLKTAVAKFEAVDKAALADLEAIQANPETAPVFSVLASLTHLPLSPGMLATAADVLKMTLTVLSSQTQTVPQAADVPQAAGPVIAGQA